jgi:tRNA-dihydrouridine synthase
VVANGDITTPEKARDVLAYTGADAIMIGRAAQGVRGFSVKSRISGNRRTLAAAGNQRSET